MGANVWKDKLFITIPRRRLGVPSTLNYVSLNSRNRHNVPLNPYPNWDMNLYPDTSSSLENFVSVYRIAIDVCDRMWFVDTGIVETLGKSDLVKYCNTANTVYTYICVNFSNILQTNYLWHLCSTF